MDESMPRPGRQALCQEAGRVAAAGPVLQTMPHLGRFDEGIDVFFLGALLRRRWLDTLLSLAVMAELLVGSVEHAVYLILGLAFYFLPATP
ncbi:MAG: hypothetical protein ACREVJ_14585 [Gammaproteobacteria bacterium]